HTSCRCGGHILAQLRGRIPHPTSKSQKPIGKHIIRIAFQLSMMSQMMAQSLTLKSRATHDHQ
ncbi:hypothetical protein, partial [Vreelandella piezotolerans]|uniref:hypothetical protein n=1 Tax=Vreelandella piezotolerans TaxID=2609667 RepID=UPI0037A61AF4